MNLRFKHRRGGLALLGLLLLALFAATPGTGGKGKGKKEEGDGGLYKDAAERERAIRYNRQREWLTLAGTLWGAAINLILLVSGLSSWLRRRAAGVAPGRLGPTIPYALANAALSTLATLPLGYYGGYVIEHRYGLSNQTRRAWAIEQAKGGALGLGLGLPLIAGVYAVIRRSPRWWWAILAGLTVPFTIVLSNLAPILILPLFNKFEPIKDRALAERIKALAAAQGVTVSDVLQMDMSKQTKKANAFFAGLGNTKRIVLADTLLEEFTPDEVEIVLAHELGHQVAGDIWKLIGLGAVTTAATAWAVDQLARPLLARYGARLGLDRREGLADVAALPLLSLLLSIVSLALSPLQNLLSREAIEHRADRYALELTRNPDAFVGAMEKLGRLNLADPQPPALVKWLLYSHPPIGERIAFGRGWRG